MLPAINFFAFRAPNSTGIVFIPSVRSPSMSLMSRILETIEKKIMIAITRLNGKAVIALSEFTRKNPAIMTDRQTRLTRNEFNITNRFRRSGGLE